MKWVSNKMRCLCGLLLCLCFVTYVRAQLLTVQDIKAYPGEQKFVVVEVAENTSVTALQFVIKLPEGLLYSRYGGTYGLSLGIAADNHSVRTEQLLNGDLLVILYNMGMKSFKKGELMSIPVTANNVFSATIGQLYAIRAATITDKGVLSQEYANIQFTFENEIPSDIKSVVNTDYEEVMSVLYDLKGLRVNSAPKGIYITGGKKYVGK